MLNWRFDRDGAENAISVAVVHDGDLSELRYVATHCGPSTDGWESDFNLKPKATVAQCVQVVTAD